MLTDKVTKLFPRNCYFNDSKVVWAYLILSIDISDTFLRHLEVSVRFYILNKQGIIGVLVRHGITQMG